MQKTLIIVITSLLALACIAQDELATSEQLATGDSACEEFAEETVKGAACALSCACVAGPPPFNLGCAAGCGTCLVSIGMEFDDFNERAEACEEEITQAQLEEEAKKPRLILQDYNPSASCSHDADEGCVDIVEDYGYNCSGFTCRCRVDQNNPDSTFITDVSNECEDFFDECVQNTEEICEGYGGYAY